MDYYTRALELKDETIAHRRYIHQNAEIGLDLPKTTAYVLAQLKSLGIEPETVSYTHLFSKFVAVVVLPNPQGALKKIIRLFSIAI